MGCGSEGQRLSQRSMGSVNDGPFWGTLISGAVEEGPAQGPQL